MIRIGLRKSLHLQKVSDILMVNLKQKGRFEMAKFPAYDQKTILDDLQAAAPNAVIKTDAASLAAHKNAPNGVGSADGDLLAYVEVGDEADIQGVLKVARYYHLPVIPQTTATSTVSGSDAVKGGILLSLKRMNQILEVSRADQVAVVQPGVINKDLDDAARKIGMFYAPDPGSKGIAAVGGNVSTNAGGMSTVKYGATKDNILGLHVILADGRKVELGHRTLKQAFGYNLTQLFVGAEGTLGIVTEITVKLMPLPLGTPITGLAFFENMTALAKAVTEVRASGVYPAMLEALDKPTLGALDRYEGTHYADESGAMLILRLDAGGQEALAKTQSVLEEFGALKVQVTSDEKEQAAILKLRQDMLPAVFANGNHVMEDMAVPLSKLAEMMDYIAKLAKDLDLEIYTAGHAGDGNVHPSIIWPKAETEVPAKVTEALQLMFRKALALGGTISGEHAVGMLKNQWNAEELGPEVDQLQHQIKSLLDPMNILNPGRKIN
ncbi:Lactate dehydrogenase (Oxidoreductase) [Loigolactobacillus bifermentans DSM 20003]|uniref:Lactate dehydrogenase (Oxidoreductase) n=2 Tax=Loigolactobacillus bifermentans TaxID=1607 RepID=A0A0R1GLP4_9LACO|nr:Lactate dehydrogenase (Oxidoreductase) [Loigolactobacillus bifermentans DSM 20003]